MDKLSEISTNIENVKTKVLGRSKLEQQSQWPSTEKKSPVHVLPPIGAGETTSTYRKTTFDTLLKSKPSIGRRVTYESVGLNKSSDQRRRG